MCLDRLSIIGWGGCASTGSASTGGGTCLDRRGKRGDGARAVGQGRRVTDLVATLARAAAASPYLKALIRRRPATVARIAADGFDATLTAAMAFDPALPVAERLRAAKADVALIVALADLSGSWPLERVTAALSAFADAALDAAIAAALAERAAANRGFAAIALGKLGSHELNYSSDVDLILLYDPALIPCRPREDAADAAVRIARRVVALMADTTGGTVFRVDLRLRPMSEVTPIALSVAAAEHYYQSEAETWERTAFIRARAAAGDIALGQGFLDAIAAFVWRRSLDYTAVRDIQAVSLRIRDHFAAGQTVGPGFDLKRGRGGIREVEFFAQIHQLIWGGREAALRAPATLDALAALGAAGRIAPDDAAALADAYRFLRTLEHRVQMVDDAQTHAWPTTVAARRAVAALDGREVAVVERDLKRHAAAVAGRYDRLIADAGGDAGVPATAAGLAAWLKAERLDAGLAALVARWRSGRYRALRSEEARRRFEAVLSPLLRALAAAGDPQHAAARLDTFLADLPAGVQFFALLAANPKLLPLFGRLLGVAPVLAEALARRPALFDALLAHDSFAALPDAAALAAELRAAATGTPEERLDRVRLWTADRRFQLGAQLIEGRDPLAVAADLSAVADAGVRVLMDAVAADFAADHGTVPGGRLVVLGLGRFGGRALTHASDLDLIYLFTGAHDAVSDGAKPLGATTYFQRLATRLTAALSVPTAAGALYDVDTRLRPSGAKGLLAVSVASFARYQADEAETWEHMALCRARVVAAAAEDAAAVEVVIARVLARPRDPAALRADVLAMRADIAAAKPGGGVWDVKLAPGGLVDLEFLVHFLQLRTGTAFTPDFRAALAMLAVAGHLPDLTGAYDTLARVLGVLRLAVAGVPPRRFTAPVADLLAHTLGTADFAAAEAAVGLAKAAVVKAWKDVFDTEAHP